MKNIQTQNTDDEGHYHSHLGFSNTSAVPQDKQQFVVKEPQLGTGV